MQIFLRVKGLVVIFENIGATLEKCRGIIKIVLLWWKGLFANIIKGRDLFAKGKRVEGLFID